VTPVELKRQTKLWGFVAIAIGVTCWILGDGHSLGVNPPIPDLAKLSITLLGWPYIIDGVRVFFGHRSFMRNFHRYAFYILAVLALMALSVWLVMWLYEALSLKAMVAIGVTAVIILLGCILLELRKRH